eukprot:3336350-Alexandrium_andersonii.AAC.1
MHFNNASEVTSDGPRDVLAGRNEILATRSGEHLGLTKVRTARHLELRRVREFGVVRKVPTSEAKGKWV